MTTYDSYMIHFLKCHSLRLYHWHPFQNLLRQSIPPNGTMISGTWEDMPLSASSNSVADSLTCFWWVYIIIFFLKCLFNCFPAQEQVLLPNDLISCFSSRGISCSSSHLLKCSLTNLCVTASLPRSSSRSLLSFERLHFFANWTVDGRTSLDQVWKEASVRNLVIQKRATIII